MAHLADDGTPQTSPGRAKRERSTRYPGAGLGECLKLCESIDSLRLDGLPATAIAEALGYKNIKTNTFSAPLSAARQFGLLSLTSVGYALTPLTREILHPVDPAGVPRLHRQAFLKPPLYAELAERLGGKRLPEPEILANVLYHNHQITAAAKRAAAEAFLESARFAGAIGNDQVLYLDGPPPAVPPKNAVTPPPPAPAAAAKAPLRSRQAEVRLDLRLWERDEGKMIRLRAPQSITPASFERFLQAFRLLVRVEDDPKEPT